MSSRLTIERILRDNDDDSGQTIRQWYLSSDNGYLMIREHKDRSAFILIRLDDIPQFIADLQQIEKSARELSAARKGPRP